MTMAITKAKANGAKAVICGSTGNTSASAAAYAGKAGMDCVVLVPEGKIAQGKLAQAIVYGAKVLQIRGNFDQALNLARELTQYLPITIVNSINPDRIEGQKTGAFEIIDVLGKAPDVLSIPVGNAGNITAYWRGFTRVPLRRTLQDPAQDVGLPGGRGRADRARTPGHESRDDRHGDPYRQPRELGPRARGHPRVTRRHPRRDRRRDPRGVPLRRAPRVDLLRPASAASIAGIIKYGVPKDSTVVCVLTGNGLKDPDTAVETSVTPDVVDATLRAARQARLERLQSCGARL